MHVNEVWGGQWKSIQDGQCVRKSFFSHDHSQSVFICVQASEYSCIHMMIYTYAFLFPVIFINRIMMLQYIMLSY